MCSFGGTTSGIRPAIADPVLLEPRDLARVVGDDPDGLHPEQVEHVGRHPVVALVVAEPERLVGLHRVQPVVLEGVGPDLVHQTDPAALLAQVEDDPRLLLADEPQRRLELVAAVAAE